MTSEINRRKFVRAAALAGLGAGMLAADRLRAEDSPPPKRRLTSSLAWRAIGVKADQRQAIELAAKHGFEAVEADGAFLAALSDDEAKALQAEVQAKGLVFGAADLPVEFRRDILKFAADVDSLARIAAGLKRVGVTRITTWVMPCHGELTYLKNFAQHTTRLRVVARLLDRHGLRLGLEYVSTLGVRNRQRYGFIHSLGEMRELIARIDEPNVGVVLDSWHWTMAGETEADLLDLRPAEIVAVDLNDAPAGIPREQQVDDRRELPCATGVIDLRAFLKALVKVGYDGPVRAEPFNQALNELPGDEACAATAKAMKQALELVSS